MKAFVTAICTVLAGLILAQPMVAQAGAQGRPHVPAGNTTPIEEVAAAGTTFAGSFVFNITITIKSTIPTTSTIWCSATASLNDGASPTNPLGGRVILEEAGVAATRSGTSATCKVTIPYSWVLITSSTDMVNLSYNITAGPNSATAVTGIVRLSDQGLGSIKVPLAGATTTETIASTI